MIFAVSLKCPPLIRKGRKIMRLFEHESKTLNIIHENNPCKKIFNISICSCMTLQTFSKAACFIREVYFLRMWPIGLIFTKSFYGFPHLLLQFISPSGIISRKLFPWILLGFEQTKKLL